MPASGRQYATLRAMFADKAAQVLDGGELSYIAENGNVVAIDGNIAEVHGVDTDVTRWTIDTVNASAAAGEYDMGLVLCGLRTAYVQRTDKPFLDEVGKYYAALEIVDDLHSVLEDVIASNGESDTMLKLAILDFDDAEAMAAEKLTPLKNDYQVVVSGKLWVDIMNATTNKKQGVEALQRVLGVTAAQTAVFGGGGKSHCKGGIVSEKVKLLARMKGPVNKTSANIWSLSIRAGGVCSRAMFRPNSFSISF